jgi:two-component system cell cycle sensor histidine kinase/response regulator CckA
MMENKSNFFFNIFLSRKKIIVTISIITVVIGLMIIFIISSYKRHKDIIVQQQKAHLLTIAQTLARNLECFVGEKIKITELYFEECSDFSMDRNNGAVDTFSKAIDKFYAVQNNYIDSVYLFNNEGQIVYCKGIDDSNFIPPEIKDTKSPFVQSLVKQKGVTVGPMFMGNGHYFLLSLVKPIFSYGKLQGFILCSINLERIYTNFISPVKIGERGYIIVKDHSRRIIMYRAKEQVGIDVIKGRKKKYPDLYYKDLENLIDRQMTGETGTAVYYSYWWTEKTISKVQKINAFSPIKVGKELWVLSVEMDYQEVETPVRNNLNNILMLSFIILVILSGSIFVMMRLAKDSQALKIETKYLKELNKSYEDLQKSEQKARHYQKLQIIGTLASGIAHEFNNLLTPILGYCEIILKNVPQDSELGEDIGEIHKIAIKAAELVKQILVYGRLDTGMHVFKPLHFSSFVEESLNMVKKVLPSSINFVEKINPDCGYIYANATMVNQILLNLCTNAYQAMKNTNGTLTIEVEKVKSEALNKSLTNLDSEMYVVLKVTDTGIGMDEATQTRIFDPFFTTKEVGEGTGLGLWVVQSIVAEHKGEITVESEQGQGTTFTIYFLWMTDNIQEESFDIDVLKPRNHLRILLVDDEADIIKVFKKGLGQMGYTVYDEMNPLSAISRFKADPDKYDVVITDYTMPKINGLELAGIIRKVRKDIKIILITGFMEQNVKELMENRSVDGFLSKPISCDDLDLKIQTLFQDIS